MVLASIYPRAEKSPEAVKRASLGTQSGEFVRPSAASRQAGQSWVYVRLSESRGQSKCGRGRRSVTRSLSRVRMRFCLGGEARGSKAKGVGAPTYSVD